MSSSGIFKKQTALKEIGDGGQEKLRSAKVLIVGAGSLAHPVASYLGAAGVGEITIADHDQIELPDLQRQVLFSPNETGQSKSLCMQQTLLEQKPWSSFQAILTKITIENITEELEDMDLIIDCSNNGPTGLLLNDACFFNKINLITSDINHYKGKISYFSFSIPDNSRTCLRCLTVDKQTKDDNYFLGASAGVVGTLQAQLALNIILDIQKEQKSFTIDFKSFQTQIIPKINNQNCELCSNHPSIEKLEFSNYHQCKKQEIFITQTHVDDCYIDIRTKEHRELFESNIQIHHPFKGYDDFLLILKDYQNEKRIVLICEKGLISNELAQSLFEQGITNIVSLYDGFDN